MRHIQRFVGDEYFVEYCNWDEVFDARRGDVAEVEVVGILVNENGNGMVSVVYLFWMYNCENLKNNICSAILYLVPENSIYNSFSKKCKKLA